MDNKGYAIIKSGSRQFRVSAGDIINIDYQSDAEAGSEISFDQVLAHHDGSKLSVGTPLISGAKVAAKILREVKGDKTVKFVHRQRKTLRKKTGHRQKFLSVKITSI